MEKIKKEINEEIKNMSLGDLYDAKKIFFVLDNVDRKYIDLINPEDYIEIYYQDEHCLLFDPSLTFKDLKDIPLFAVKSRSREPIREILLFKMYFQLMNEESFYYIVKLILNSKEEELYMNSELFLNLYLYAKRTKNMNTLGLFNKNQIIDFINMTMFEKPNFGEFGHLLDIGRRELNLQSKEQLISLFIKDMTLLYGGELVDKLKFEDIEQLSSNKIFEYLL